MYRMGRTTAALALAAVALAVPPAGAQPAPVSTTVVLSPATDLVDGQVVTVTGTAPGGTWVNVVQCAAGSTQSMACDVDGGRWVPADAAGTFTTQLEVHMVVASWTGETTDCRDGDACVVAALPEGDAESAGTAAVTFAPGAEPRPAPALAVDPTTGLVDGQLVSLTGSGLTPDAWRSVWQCAPSVPDGCRYVTEVEVTAEGTFVTDAVVSARVLTWEGPVDCRTSVPACELVVGAGNPRSPRAGRVALAFDPDGPLPPPPAIVVDPAEGVTDPGPVTITGTDFTRGGPVSVALCRDDGPESWGCEAETSIYTTADPAGGVAVTLDAASTFGFGDLTNELVDCRQEPGCAVIARDEMTGLSATAPVAFGPLAAGRGRYLDPVFPEVDITHDVVYHRAIRHDGEPVDLRMDVFQPAGDTATQRPVVMNMHGGFFIFGNEDQLASSSFAYARLGYVSVSISYRLRPGMGTGDLPGQIDAGFDAYEDALVAVQWLRDHADEYRIDPDAIAASGYSAGGALAFAFAYGPGEYGPEVPVVAAALPMAGASVVTPQPGAPPVLAQHGTADTLLPIDNARDICAQARAIGEICEFVEYAGEGHIISQRRELFRRSVDFLAEHMLTPRGYLDPPVAAAGDDVTLVEGARVTLDASASADPDGGALTYAWAPADHLDDPSSPTPIYTGDDNGSEVLTLTVTDARGMQSTDDVSVTTANAPPVLTVTPSTEVGSPHLGLTADIGDPGTADTHTVAVDWGDGTVEPSATELSHTFAEPGRYPVGVTVTDDDGGTATWQGSLVVGCTRVGTDRADVLIGLWHDDVICGLGGDDIIVDISGDDALYGGPGDDLLHGGRGDDVLVGGDGRDRAWGGPGRDTCTAERTGSC